MVVRRKKTPAGSWRSEKRSAIADRVSHPLAPGGPLPADPGKERIGRRIAHEDDVARRESALDLGIPLQVDREIAQHRILERRDDRSGVFLGAGDDDRAARDVEAPGDAPDEDLIDLLGFERRGHLLQDVHHLRARAGLGACLVELPPHPEVRLDPGEQLANPERLGNEVGGTEAERADRGLLGWHRGDHQHRQVLEARIGLDALEQLEAVHSRHHDVEQQEVERLRLQMLEQVLAAGDREHLVAVLLEDPGERAGQRLVVVGYEDLGSERHSAHQPV